MGAGRWRPAVPGDPWYMAILMETTVLSSGDTGSDLVLVLAFNGGLSTVHLSLQIRWTFTIILNLSYMAAYALCVGLGSREMMPFAALVLHCGIIVQGSISHRAAELNDRAAFSKLLKRGRGVARRSSISSR